MPPLHHVGPTSLSSSIAFSFICISLILSGCTAEVRCKKLFVFGDSYADTGNIDESVQVSWNEPYGISFPGRPTGRFSDGRVLTDNLADFMGLASPVPYKQIHTNGNYSVGVNFAYGGAGVFKTLLDVPTIPEQVDLFQQLLTSGAPLDLGSSVALVTLSGNDYHAFRIRNPSASQGEVMDFIENVVEEVSDNIKRLSEMGIEKLLVCGLPTFGCLPENTMSTSFQSCNVDYNAVAAVHNTVLSRQLETLNSAYNPPPYLFLDIYASFMSALNNPSAHGFVDALRPCCLSINGGDTCGRVGKNGERLYRLCGQPSSSFFWDNFHPTQRGWQVVFSFLSTHLSL